MINSVPLVHGVFRLKKFSVSLVNNFENQEGIEIFSRGFDIDLKKYDENIDNNLHAFILVAKNEEFGVNQLIRIDKQIFRSALIQREKSNDKIIDEED